MKQILIITRIEPNSGEFGTLFSGRVEPVIAEYEDLKLTIHDGAGIYDDEVENIANNIVAKVDRSAAEVLFVIHYSSDDFSDLSDALKNMGDGATWQVTQYSGTDSNYDSEIKPLFVNAISESSVVKAIYRLFGGDPELEAKLELLHNCLQSNSVPTALHPLLMKQHQQSFELFNTERHEKLWCNTEYIDALTKLRKSLLGS